MWNREVVARSYGTIIGLTPRSRGAGSMLSVPATGRRETREWGKARVANLAEEPAGVTVTPAEGGRPEGRHLPWE